MGLPAECRGLKQNFDRNNTLMIVGYAAAGVMAIGSTILFLLSSESGPPPDQPPWRASLMSEGADSTAV